jgi:hypothetical protein
MLGLLRLASFPGTQSLVPPDAGNRRASYKSAFGAQRVGILSTRPDTLRARPLDAPKSLSVPGPATETKWLVLCSVWQFTSLGAAQTSEATILPGLQQ